MPGSIAEPATGAFTIDCGNASAINIGGTSATTLTLGRTGQNQAPLGNVTIAGVRLIPMTSGALCAATARLAADDDARRGSGISLERSLWRHLPRTSERNARRANLYCGALLARPSLASEE